MDTAEKEAFDIEEARIAECSRKPVGRYDLYFAHALNALIAINEAKDPVDRSSTFDIAHDANEYARQGIMWHPDF